MKCRLDSAARARMGVRALWCDARPDTCGKGTQGALPLSAVIGRADIMDVYPPASMTANAYRHPICLAAALANLEVIDEEGLVERSRVMGEMLQPALRDLAKKFPDHIGTVHGKGLVAALHIVKPGGIEPNGHLTGEIVRCCIEKGLMMFAPVGYHGSSLKLCPPLMIEEEAISESLEVLEQAIAEAIAGLIPL